MPYPFPVVHSFEDVTRNQEWVDTNVQISTSGVLLGVTAQRPVGLWGVTPVVQPSATGTNTGFTANAGTGMNSLSTATGGVGSAAYNFQDVVRALKQSGVLKS
jgi:hypothetical protein